MRGGRVVGTVVLLTVITGCEPGAGSQYDDGSQFEPGRYSVRESGVALRDGTAACATNPGTGNCGNVLTGLEPGDWVYPLCQREGQLVGQNSWWVYAEGPGGNVGWVASWYLDCPSNILPGIDECTDDRFD
jgi:hypothetical protein